MNDTPDEEQQLRRQFLQKANLDSVPAPPSVDSLIAATVRKANAQTGGRDLLLLAISSFFAFLLVLCAPLAAGSVASKRPRNTTKESNPKSQ
ncbi:MAG: hypothetical protein ACI9Y1_002466 [Lentisphaeria bacterium]|jgi:hypothetical protein